MQKFIVSTLSRIPYLMPALRCLYRNYEKLRLKRKYSSAEDVFDDIYTSNAWHDSESISGPGSNIESTNVVRKELPLILEEYDIHSMLDIPCGDFNWMKEINLNSVEYTGADIVGAIISENKKYERLGVQFKKLNIISDPLPSVDLIFSRDCLVHLSLKDIIKSLENICQTNSRYLLTTTFPKQSSNYDIATGQWRALDLQVAPFNFPPPVLLVSENCTEEKWKAKSLGLWEIDRIRELISDL